MQNTDKLVDGALARGDGQEGALSGLARQLGEQPVADALWKAVRQRDARVVENESIVTYLRKGSDFSGRDVAAYVELLASVWGPKGERRFSWGSRLGWGDDAPAGLSHGVRTAVELVTADADRLAEFMARVPGFELPWRHGVVLALRAARVAKAPDLDDAYLDDLAQRWVKSHWAPDWVKEFGLDEGRFRAALTRSLATVQLGDVHPGALRYIAPWAPPALFFDALDRVNFENSELRKVFEAAALFRAREPAKFDARFEEIFARPSLQRARLENARYSTWPAFYALFGSLAHRRTTGEGPFDKGFDAGVATVLDGFRLPWSGGSVEEFLDALGALLAVLPVERLERIFALQSAPHPALAAQIRSAKCLRLAAKAVAAHEVRPGYGPPQEHIHAARILAKSAEGVEAAVAELREGSGPSRGLLVRELVSCDLTKAAEGLVVALADSSKGVRETAREGLIRNEWKAPREVFSLLEGVVRSRSKDARLEAARVLLAWPDAQSAAETARAALGSEKIAGIVTLLKQTAARAEPSEAAPAASEAPATAKPKGKSKKAAAAPVVSSSAAPEDPALAAAVAKVRAMLATEGHGMSPWSFDSWVTRELPTEYAARALAGVITAGEYERLDQIGRKPHLDVEHLLVWLARNAPAAAIEAFACNVDHKRVRPVEASVDGLANAGPAGAARAALMLAGANDKTRTNLAAVLRRAGTAAELAPIEAVLAANKGTGARAALEAARAATAAAALDVTKYDSTREGDAKLDAALAVLPKGQGQAPQSPLRTSSGHALSDEARAWFVGQLRLEDIDRRGAPVRAVRARLRDDDCAALCDELVRAPYSDLGWGLFSRAVIAGPAQVDQLAARLDTYATQQQGEWGAHAVEVLVRLGTHQAVRALDRAHRTTKRASLRSRAQSGLARLARSRGTEVDALLDAALERFGFDPAGTRAIPYAGKTLALHLGANNELSYALGVQSPSSKIPAPRKGNADDAVVKREVAQLAKDLKRSTTLQRTLWERALALGTRWTGGAFTERFAVHPLAKGPARGLLFLCERAEGAHTALAPFVLDDARRPVDLAGRAFALRDEDSITIAHPLRLRPEELSAAKGLFSRESRTQPFAQLDRKHFAPDDPAAKREARVQLALPGDKLGYIVTRLNRLGYEPGDRQDAGLVFSSSRPLGAYCIHLAHDGYVPGNPEELLGNPDCSIESARVSRDGAMLAYEALPPTLFSELLRDLWLLGGGDEGAPPSDEDEDADEG